MSSDEKPFQKFELPSAPRTSYMDIATNHKDCIPLVVDIDDAIERLGMGMFQIEILIAAGLCFAAEAMEVLLLSFLAIILKSEWDLSERQTNSIIAVVFVGAMIGTLILGPLGDRIGRKPIFSVTAAIIAIFGLVSAACPNYRWFLLARFMVGFGTGGSTVPFDILAEFLPTSQRGQHLLYIEFFWTGGTLLVPIVAWSCKNGPWQTFVILCAIPCVLSTILCVRYVPESPRWLLTVGNHDRAIRILRHAAQRNQKDPWVVFPDGTKLIQKEIHTSSKNFYELFSPQWRKITMFLWAAWFGYAFLYYGVIIAVSRVFSEGQTEDQSGDGSGHYSFDYSAIVISASSEIAGLVVVLMTVDKWGRIVTQVATYVGGGLSCLILGLLASADAPRYALVLFAFAARMFMMGATCTTWVSTAEILSTSILATGHSAANAVSNIGGFLSPFVISESISPRAMGVVMLAVSILTGLAAWQLPETNGKALGEVHIIDSLPASPEEEESPDSTYRLA